MATERKHSLPVVKADKPTLEAARKRLGGRLSGAYSGAGAGRVVAIDTKDRGKLVGVLVFASESEHHVLVDAGVVRVVSVGATMAHMGELTGELARLAADVQLFAALREQDEVCCETEPGRTTHGTLLEKCRYGALVAAPDGRILAVGFRKLWPKASGCC